MDGSLSRTSITVCWRQTENSSRLKITKLLSGNLEQAALSGTELFADRMTIRAVQLELPARGWPDLVMPALLRPFIKPQARAGVHLITDAPQGKKFLDEILWDFPQFRLIDDMVNAKWGSTNCPTTGSAAFAGCQDGKRIIHEMTVARKGEPAVSTSMTENSTVRLNPFYCPVRAEFCGASS